MDKYHPLLYVLIPDLAQAEQAITILEAKIEEIGSDEEAAEVDKLIKSWQQ